jgi:hypothetical protein
MLRLCALAVVFGVVALLGGHVISHYLYPKPHWVIGSALAIAALFLGRRHPRFWFVAACGVALPFVAIAPYSISTLQQTAEDFELRITTGDYLVMLSPIAAAVVGAFLGRLLARPPGSAGRREHKEEPSSD